MYIIVPLSLIAVSLLIIGVIVFRKLPYLRKLTPESHEFGPTIFHDFFPEVFSAIERIHFEQYVAATLREMEKLLRKVRLVFSRIDRASTDLISELRHASNQKQSPLPAEEEPVSMPDVHVDVRPRNAKPDLGQLKAEEQRLIVEIAQHPKNPDLYSSLAEVYIAMGNFQDAEEALEAALSFDKNNQSLRDRLSFAERKLHETTVGF